MQNDEIEKFLDNKTTEETSYIQISFKKRNTMFGLFVKDRDYADLKSKNFWRIVPQSQLDAFNKSKDMNLAKIFNGQEFSRLTLYKESFDL